MSKFNINANYGLIIIQDLQIVYVDQTYAQIYGYTSAQELQQQTNSFLDLIDPAYHQETFSNYQKLIDGSLQPRGKTYTNIDKNGRQFTVFTIDHIVEWKGRKAIQVTVIDMSIFDKADKHTENRNLMYQKLITESAQAIMIHRKFKPLLVNNAFVQAIQAPSMSELLRKEEVLSFLIQDEKERLEAYETYYAIYHGQMKGHKIQVPITTMAGEKRIFNIYNDYIEWENGPAIRAVLEDVTEKVELQKQLEQQAKIDQLSQLYNRHAIYEWLDDIEIKNSILHCILIDIDDFKSINEAFGHNIGDKAIKMVADICKKVIGDKGIVGRWGGEEFIIFLPKSTCLDVYSYANEIREACEQNTVQYKEENIHLTISAGITNTQQSCTETFSVYELVNNADALLYQAKHRGKNQIATSCSND